MLPTSGSEEALDIGHEHVNEPDFISSHGESIWIFLVPRGMGLETEGKPNI